WRWWRWGSGYSDGLDSVETFADGGSTVTTRDGQITVTYEQAPDDAPQNVTATPLDGDSVEVDFDPVAGADGYRAYRDTEPGVTTGDTLVDDVSAPPVTDTGLLDGTAYHYVVVAYIDAEGPTSTEVSARTDLPAPYGLDVTAERATEFDCVWNAAHDNGTTRLECKPTDASEWGSAAPGGAETVVDHTVEEATLTGLRTGEDYDIRVVAVTEDAETPDTDPATAVVAGTYGGERYGSQQFGGPE
ncbi:fibronectin type III domain-containing protein, partial [Halobellus rufus]|uniref:fibronectin type III domain-containing protein n=1 Tax=Halobellus rufus TaxID=1448860 RepID=UPI0018CDA885